MIKAYVENIYGDVARVMIGDEGVAIAVPLRQLPRDTHEGTVMRLHFTVDQGATLAKKNAAKNSSHE